MFVSKTDTRYTTKSKFIRTLVLSLLTSSVHSCYHRLKMSSFGWRKALRFRTIDLTVRVLAINVTTAFTILKYLEHVFLKDCLV